VRSKFPWSERGCVVFVYRKVDACERWDDDGGRVESESGAAVWQTLYESGLNFWL